MAFVWLPLPDPERYRWLVVAEEPRLVALAAGHPLAARDRIDFADLLDEPFLALPAGAGPLRDHWLATDARGGRPVVVGAEVASTEETYEALAAGLGVVLVAPVSSRSASGDAGSSPPSAPGNLGLDPGAVPREVGVAQPRPPEHREVERGRHLARRVVPVRRPYVGVEGAQRPGPGLHPGGLAAPASAERGQHVDGVVAGAEEHPVPQVGDLVGAALGDADPAAARTDRGQFPLAHLMPDTARQRGQHGEREQGLQGAGRGQRAVRVVGGEHLAGAGVGHHPGERGDLWQTRCPGARPDLDAGPVEQVGLGADGPWSGGRAGVRRSAAHRRGGRREHQQPRRDSAHPDTATREPRRKDPIVIPQT
ncbi:hypothetical protein SFUMM280S_05658 [Streptomyces fumanus]